MSLRLRVRNCNYLKDEGNIGEYGAGKARGESGKTTDLGTVNLSLDLSVLTCEWETGPPGLLLAL